MVVERRERVEKVGFSKSGLERSTETEEIWSCWWIVSLMATSGGIKYVNQLDRYRLAWPADPQMNGM